MDATLKARILAAAKTSVFNQSDWNPVGEPTSLKELWAAQFPGMYEKIEGDTAVVTATTFEDGSIGYRISVPIQGGQIMQLKLSGKSALEEGDEVKIDTITGQLLAKAGSDDIIRYDGAKAA